MLPPGYTWTARTQTCSPSSLPPPTLALVRGVPRSRPWSGRPGRSEIATSRARRSPIGHARIAGAPSQDPCRHRSYAARFKGESARRALLVYRPKTLCSRRFLDALSSFALLPDTFKNLLSINGLDLCSASGQLPKSSLRVFSKLVGFQVGTCPSQIEWRRYLPLACWLSACDHHLPMREILDSGVGLRYARNG